MEIYGGVTRQARWTGLENHVRDKTLGEHALTPSPISKGERKIMEDKETPVYVHNGHGTMSGSQEKEEHPEASNNK